jgi:hypothetical protein
MKGSFSAGMGVFFHRFQPSACFATGGWGKRLIADRSLDKPCGEDQGRRLCWVAGLLRLSQRPVSCLCGLVLAWVARFDEPLPGVA